MKVHAMALAVFVESSFIQPAGAEPAASDPIPVSLHRTLYPFHPGAVIGLKGLYALPFGTFGTSPAGTVAMQDIAGPPFIAELEVGYQTTPKLFLGGHLGMGFAAPGTAAKRECSREGLSCHLSLVDFGVDAEWRFGAARASPWVGLGVAAETQTLSRRAGGFKSDLKSYGLGVRAAFGMDVRVSGGVVVGPVVEYRLGTFFSTVVESFATLPGEPIATVGSDADISGGLHQAVAFGLRGRWYAGER
ncbi:MAG TPA: hypothetical protein VHE30_11660 [Polyangiaceae bacterium]|nr:hypothetical protein [Polyangiaceae bacterium]